MLELITKFIRDEEGQGIAEYALILVLIALGVIAVLTTFREQIISVFTNISDTLGTAN